MLAKVAGSSRKLSYSLWTRGLFLDSGPLWLIVCHRALRQSRQKIRADFGDKIVLDRGVIAGLRGFKSPALP